MTETYDSTVRLVERLTAERDRARAIAVALEQRLARVEALAEEWEAAALDAMQGWGLSRQNWVHWRFVEGLRHALDTEAES